MQYQARHSIVGIPYSEHVLTLLVTSSIYVGTYFLSLWNPLFFLLSLGPSKQASKQARETKKKSPTIADFGKEVGR